MCLHVFARERARKCSNHKIFDDGAKIWPREWPTVCFDVDMWRVTSCGDGHGSVVLTDNG